MIKLTINGVHYKISPRERSYIKAKIGQLDHLMPTHAKKSASGQVYLRRQSRTRADFVCEVQLNLPKKQIFARSKASQAQEAIDKVEDRLARQIRKYKTASDKTTNQNLIRRFWRRVWPLN